MSCYRLLVHFDLGIPTFPDLVTPSATTANGKAIMDLAIEFPIFSNFNLNQTNLVRIHLKVHFYQT